MAAAIPQILSDIRFACLLKTFAFFLKKTSSILKRLSLNMITFRGFLFSNFYSRKSYYCEKKN